MPLLSLQTLFLTALTLPAAAGIVSDSFESYTSGSFPTEPWHDIRSCAADNPTPAPTMSIIETTDAHGKTTQALQSNATNGTNGAFFDIDHARTHTVTADLRIDRLAAPNQGWPMGVGFANSIDNGNDDVNGNPHAVIYAWTDRRFRLFIRTGDGAPGRDFVITGPRFDLDTWYTLSLQVDTATGAFEARVLDAVSGETLSTRSVTSPQWDQELGMYDAAAFFDGETPGSTFGQATLDNVSYVPAPWAAYALLFSGALACRRRR